MGYGQKFEIEERKGWMEGKQCKKVNFILDETRKYFKGHKNENFRTTENLNKSIRN